VQCRTHNITQQINTPEHTSKIDVVMCMQTQNKHALGARNDTQMTSRTLLIEAVNRGRDAHCVSFCVMQASRCEALIAGAVGGTKQQQQSKTRGWTVPVVRTTRRKHTHRPLVCPVFQHMEHETLELEAVKQRQTGQTMPHYMPQAERAAQKSCWVQTGNKLVAKWQQTSGRLQSLT
jgi:hypothetical protein